MHALYRSIMNTMIGYDKNRLSVLHLEPNVPASVRAVAGTVVACLHGRLWITQSGARDDFVVVSGYRYLSRTSGLIVVNALHGPGTALIYWQAPEHTAISPRYRVSLDADSAARLVQDAHRQRHLATVELLRRFCRSLRHLVRAVVSRVRVGKALRWQQPCRVNVDRSALKNALTQVRLEHVHAKTQL